MRSGGFLFAFPGNVLAERTRILRRRTLPPVLRTYY
jgi:hypothetical protein